MWSIWSAGLMAGLALIVAIGAQNAFVLRQGIRREHMGAVVMLCVTGDAVLIFGGTLGVGTMVAEFPMALIVLKWTGAAYLAWWVVRSLAAALKPSSLMTEAPQSLGSVVTTTLAVTYLNPHSYLDTVVLLGVLANQHGSDYRWAFAAGALAGSVLWFPALGYGARAMSNLLAKPAVWRIIDLTTGVVMILLIVNLMLHKSAA